MTLNPKLTCTASIKGIIYSATLDTPIPRPALYEVLPSSSYVVTLRAGDTELGKGVWDGQVLLSGARVDADPALEQRVFSALQHELAARCANS